MRRHHDLVQPTERQIDLEFTPPTLFPRRVTLTALLLHHKLMNPTQRHDRRLIVHVREANPKPPRLRAMERCARRDVELNVLDDQPP